MSALYERAVDWFDRVADDISLLLDRLLGGLMALTAILFALITFASFFG